MFYQLMVMVANFTAIKVGKENFLIFFCLTNTTLVFQRLKYLCHSSIFWESSIDENWRNVSNN